MAKWEGRSTEKVFQIKSFENEQNRDKIYGVHVWWFWEKGGGSCQSRGQQAILDFDTYKQL